MLLQEDVHSPLTLFLPRCLQTFPVCNVILWQSINFSFDGQVLHWSDFACYSYRKTLSLPLSLMDLKNKVVSTEDQSLLLLSPLVLKLKELL